MTDIVLEDLLAQIKVETADSQLNVLMPESKLPVGKHRFGLSVVDDSGNQSAIQAQITVIVVDKAAPTAVLDLLDDQGKLLSDGQVAFGSGFILSGNRSLDIGGTVSNYIWEVLPA